MKTMPKGFINGVNLYYEEAGHAVPMIFVHEFAGEARSWAPQVRFFRRWYRTITFNARGYPPSDVPEDPAAYSQRQAVEDIRGVLDYLRIEKAHVIGLSMGGYATLHFGLLYPERALSLVVAGAGYGSKADERETFRRDCAALAERFEREPMEKVAAFMRWDPRACSSARRTLRAGSSSASCSNSSPHRATPSRCVASDHAGVDLRIR